MTPLGSLLSLFEVILTVIEGDILKDTVKNFTQCLELTRTIIK